MVGDAVGATVQPVHVKRQLAYHVGSVSQNPSRRAWAHWAGSNMSANDASPMIAEHLVGDIDGSVVGSVVGAAEGDSVGTADGVLVGAAVGDTVHPVQVKRQLA